MIWIGIDTGTHTGLAVWDDTKREFLEIETLSIHKALDKVRWYKDFCSKYGQDLFVIFEDARQRNWFGERTNAKLQGAGSIKRDCAIWEDFLKDEEVQFRAMPPQKGCTKLSADYFKKVTGWQKQTSNHARDAAMLVIGR